MLTTSRTHSFRKNLRKKHFAKPFLPVHMGPSRVLKNNFLKSRYTVPLSSLARNRAPLLTPNLEIMYQNFKIKSSYHAEEKHSG